MKTPLDILLGRLAGAAISGLCGGALFWLARVTGGYAGDVVFALAISAIVSSAIALERIR